MNCTGKLNEEDPVIEQKTPLTSLLTVPECCYCGLKGTPDQKDTISIEEHEKTCKENTGFKCLHCEMRFNSILLMRTHEKKCNPTARDVILSNQELVQPPTIKHATVISSKSSYQGSHNEKKPSPKVSPRATKSTKTSNRITE